MVVARRRRSWFLAIVFIMVAGLMPASTRSVAAAGPATPIVSAPLATVVEGDAGQATMHFVLSLDRVLTTPVTVDVETQDGSAVAPDDYVALPLTTVTFAPGTTVKVVDVTVEGDTLDEFDYESLYLVLTNPSGADFSNGATETAIEGRIQDDDKTPPATPIVSAPLATVVEGDAGQATMHFVLSLDRVLTTPVTVDVETQDGSAVAPDDYVALPLTTVTFAPGTTVKVVDVTVEGDTLDEFDYESLYLVLTNPSGADFSNGATETAIEGRIQDDDKTPPATPIVSAPLATVVEGDAGQATMHFVLSLDRVLTTPVTVDVETQDGSAVAPDDYVALPLTTVTFAPGTTVKVVDVTVEGDTLDEFDYESLYLVLTNPSGADFSNGATETAIEGRIQDDDGAVSAPLPEVRVGRASVVEGGDGDTGALHFAVVLDRPATSTVSVDVQSFDNGATVADGDYDAIPLTTLTFTPGQQVKDVVVTTHGDSRDEGESEAMYLQLSNAVGATIGFDYQFGFFGFAFGTIYDDDITEVPLPEVRVGRASVVEGGDGDTGALHFAVVLDRPATSTVSVDVQSFDNGATVADGDYDAIPLTTLTFTPGQQVKDVVVTTHGDSRDEGELEAMYLQLSNAVGATIGFDYQFGFFGFAFGTIYDDDITEVPLPEVRVGRASVVEGGDGDTGALHFAVVLDRPATSTVSVDVQSFDNGATVADGDYDAIPLTTLTFTPGQQVKDVVVTTHGDSRDEGELEAMYLQLSNAVGATIGFDYQFGFFGSAFGTIYDDDVPGPGELRFTSSFHAVGESDGSVAIEVDRVGGLTGAVSVHYSMASGSATDGLDFTAANGTLDWPDGDETSRTITVAILPDAVLEGPEDFTITLDDPAGGATLGTPATTTVRINDDEIDHLPMADAGPTASGAEGSPIQLDGAASDAENPAPSIGWSATGGAGTDPGASCSFFPSGSADPEVTCTDDGTYLLTIFVSDGVNTTVTDTTSLTVANVDPTVAVTTPSTDQSFDLGVSVAVSATIDDPGSNDSHTCTIDWGDSAAVPGTVTFGTCAGSHSYAAPGPRTISVTATDDDGGTGSDSVGITVTNTTNPPPEVHAGTAPAGVGEGAAVPLSGSATDTEPITTLWTASPGRGRRRARGLLVRRRDRCQATTVTCTDDGTWALTLTATDGTNPPVSDSLTLVLANRDPHVDVTAPVGGCRRSSSGRAVDVSAALTDPGTNDSQDCAIAWGDGTTTTGAVAAGVCTGSHAYAAALGVRHHGDRDRRRCWLRQRYREHRGRGRPAATADGLDRRSGASRGRRRDDAVHLHGQPRPCRRRPGDGPLGDP